MARCDNAVLTFLELGIQCGCAHRQASECDGVGNLELTLGVGLILPGSRAYVPNCATGKHDCAADGSRENTSHNYDPVKSFAPVTILATGPNVLAINPRLPVSSVNDLIRLAQQKPGELEYASAGIGTFQHLGGELFKLMAGVDILHVPYKGGGPAMTDVISGHVNIVFSSLIQTTPFIQSGQLEALGTGGQQRSPVLPDVPTIAEAGVPGYEANNWWGIVAPAGTPLPIVEKLRNDVHAALQSPSLQEQFAREGASAVEMSSAEFGKYIVTEITKWGEVVEKSKIRPQ